MPRSELPFAEAKAPATESVSLLQGSNGNGRAASGRAQERGEEIADQELHAILGPGTSFHGTLSFSGQVRIDGEFSGQVLGGKVLVIGGGAKVQGELRAAQVIVLGGSVKADIVASVGIELYVPAHVTGDLQAPDIYMDKGIRFTGTCDLSEPTYEDEL